MGKKIEIKMSENLERYLKSHRAYSKACKNIIYYEKSWTTDQYTLIRLSDAFIWKRTPEGHKYWSELSVNYDASKAY